MVDKLTNEIKKEGVTFDQFVKEIGIDPERARAQFKEAGIEIANKNHMVSEEQKQKLLRYLQQHHGAKLDATPEKIVLRRAKTSEIKIGGSHGAAKTVSIQVRKNALMLSVLLQKKWQRLKRQSHLKQLLLKQT